MEQQLSRPPLVVGGVVPESTTIGGVECVEILDPPAPADPPTKRYLCRWPERYTLAIAILGLAMTKDAEGHFVREGPPQRFPGDDRLFARSVEIDGHGRPDAEPEASRPTFRYAVVAVRYGALDWGGAAPA